ncbi:hypothetical protein V2G26_014555 [Clonostachys chloroleuca]
MSSGKVKAVQLWDKSKDDLTKQLGELKTELGQLRIQKVASSGSKLNKIHDLRKSIARVLTVINAKQRAQLRLFYKNKKYAPWTSAPSRRAPSAADYHPRTRPASCRRPRSATLTSLASSLSRLLKYHPQCLE